MAGAPAPPSGFARCRPAGYGERLASAQHSIGQELPLPGAKALAGARTDSMTERMRIILNGSEREVPARISVLELLEVDGEPVRHVLVEVNGRHLRLEEYAGERLAEGDRVEIILPLFGG